MAKIYILANQTLNLISSSGVGTAKGTFVEAPMLPGCTGTFFHCLVLKDTKVVFVLEGEVKPDKEWVIQYRQHFLLSTNILYFLLPDNVPFF